MNITMSIINKLHEKVTSEALSYDALQRMNGLVNQRDIQKIRDAVRSIRNDLKSDGFETRDADEYIKSVLKFTR